MEELRETDEKYMRLAIEEAKLALEADEVPIGAIIVAGGRIVGRGHNLVETLTDVTAHAELQAITAAASTIGGTSEPQGRNAPPGAPVTASMSGSF